MNSEITILIADDDPNILEILAYNLVKEGYNVVQAENGAEAIKMAEEHNPHLLILDVMMPEMNGVDVCAELREREQFQDTFITFLTARDDDFSQITCYEAGGDDFMSKPIKPKVLLSRIKALLKRVRKATNTSHLITIGDFVINKESYTVEKSGEPLQLVKKEFELLSLLASKQGKVYTREEIFDKVWDADIIVGDRTIDVHIRKLREKIGSEFITTIKGIGYKFEG